MHGNPLAVDTENAAREQNFVVLSGVYIFNICNLCVSYLICVFCYLKNTRHELGDHISQKQCNKYRTPHEHMP